MRGRIVAGIAWMLWLGLAVGPAPGQSVRSERSVSVTGPRGRTIEREVSRSRGPGYAGREVEIRRPGGTLSREVGVRRGPGYVHREAEIQHAGVSVGREVEVRRGPVVHGPGPVHYRPGPPVVVRRNVIVERGPSWGPSIAIAAPFFNFALNRPAFYPPPPPVFVAPPPVIVPAPVVAPPPVVVAPAPAPIPPADPLAEGLARLQSSHDNSRRDGALALGQMADPRAVPALIDRLEHDGEKDVRIASAWALAEIGDPRAGVALERAALFDRKREVREAADSAYRRLPREAPMAAEPPAPIDPGAPAEGYDPEPIREAPPLPPEPTPLPSADEPDLPPALGPVGFPDSR